MSTTSATPKKRPKNGDGNGARSGEGVAAAPTLLSALRALKRGDFSVRLRDDLTGTDGQIASTFNEIVDLVSTIRNEAREVSGAVGKEGQARRMRRLEATGGWDDYVSAINDVIEDLTQHTNEIARVITAVAHGDLDQAMLLEHGGGPLRGESLRHAKIVNGMVARLAQFTSEVTRVAQEVGGEGKLGGQARVQGVAGVWKDLTDSVNLMASNLTS